MEKGWIVTGLSLIVLSLCTSFGLAEEVIDRRTGYSLQLPPGWERIPDDVIQQTFSAITKPGSASPNYVGAFQPAEHATYFQYPYVLIQIHSYENGASLSSISRQEIQDLVVALTGLKPHQLKQDLSENASELLQGAEIGSATVLNSPPGFVMPIKLNVAGIGPVQGRSYCLFGRTNAALLHFYTKETDWAQHAPLYDSFVRGFARTPDQTVVLGNATVTSEGRTLRRGFDWSQIWSKTIIGALVGALLGGLHWARSRGKPKK